MTPFSEFAPYYDLLYQDKDYAREAQWIDTCVHQYETWEHSEHRPLRVLDLGCGTGRHAAELEKIGGYQISGIDSSAAMVERAIDRGIDAQVGDVRSFRAPSISYDVVLSLFHVASYQLSGEDLSALFETARLHLKPQGLLLFDFWYGPAVLTQSPETRTHYVVKDNLFLCRIAEGGLLPDENRVTVDYTLYVGNRPGGMFQQLREKHTLRYWFLPELRDRLLACGFGVLDIWTSRAEYDGKIVARRL